MWRGSRVFSLLPISRIALLWMFAANDHGKKRHIQSKEPRYEYPRTHCRVIILAVCRKIVSIDDDNKMPVYIVTFATLVSSIRYTHICTRLQDEWTHLSFSFEWATLAYQISFELHITGEIQGDSKIGRLKFRRRESNFVKLQLHAVIKAYFVKTITVTFRH